MNKKTVRVTFGVLAAVYVLTHLIGHAHAQSSLGIGASEAQMPSTGQFSSTLNWINAQQQSFYRSLTGALKAMRDGQGGIGVLVGLSFLYGVFHAAGPGHGKAVISSYMLANEATLRRGVLLSFVSAFLQAVSAVVLMGLVFLLLRGTAVSMTDAAWFLEVASYALITLFGLWLLWRKAGFASPGAPRRAHSLGAAAVQEVHHHHAHGEACACDHAHAPDPKLLGGERLGGRAAWTAVAAVGVRPCTGALIVLSFAFLNGLWMGGVLSVLAMALGTAITVSVLAILAVTAKDVAIRLAGGGGFADRLHHGIEIAGAGLVFLFGLLLLSASLQA
ncbi:MAG TPA: nickel/cobalt transporter [Mesorhizobium sp.]|jgi:ABC-type nickel/cobalt efflux system permease component RcnA|nr:nickel/cobalt transporter [Mesorhizobium sp.]